MPAAVQGWPIALAHVYAASMQKDIEGDINPKAYLDKLKLYAVLLKNAFKTHLTSKLSYHQ